MTTTPLNKIFINSPIQLNKADIFNMCFIDGLLTARENFSIANNTLSLFLESSRDISVIYGYNNGVVYEYNSTLLNNNTIIAGKDIFGVMLQDINAENILVFVNGKLLTKSQYKILNSTSIQILLDYAITKVNKIQIYKGNFFRSEEIQAADVINHLRVIRPYNQNNVLIFKNGEKISFLDINKADLPLVNSESGKTIIVEGCSFESAISATDKIEYVIINGSCFGLHFEGERGYLEYGPRDYYNKNVPVFYDTQVTLQDLSNLLIDNIRYGFFIKEANGPGVLLIIDNTFQTPNLRCVTINKFSKTLYKKDEYYVQVPDAKSIVDYLAPYDRQYVLLPEVLEVFQSVVLNEIHDEILRIRDLRSLSRIDSQNIDKLIKFLGLTVNIQDFSLANKRALLEELNNFYRIAGTEKSYNYYDIITGDANIISMDQLFTYHNSTDPNKREYVDFFSKKDFEGNGYTLHREYVIGNRIDYGYVSSIATKHLDYGFIPHVSLNYDYDIYFVDDVNVQLIRYIGKATSITTPHTL